MRGSKSNRGKVLMPPDPCYPWVSALDCTKAKNGMATCESQVYRSKDFKGDFEASPFETRETDHYRCYIKFTVVKSSKQGTRLLHSTCSNYCSNDVWVPRVDLLENLGLKNKDLSDDLSFDQEPELQPNQPKVSSTTKPYSKSTSR